MARPTFKATAALRHDVRLMKADGWSDDRIAGQLGISRSTLLKHFAVDLEYGSDRVRRQALKDLAKASKRGNVAGAKALLALSGIVPPPSPKQESRPEKLGKKAEAEAAAETAHEGNDWGALVRH